MVYVLQIYWKIRENMGNDIDSGPGYGDSWFVGPKDLLRHFSFSAFEIPTISKSARLIVDQHMA